MKPIPFAEINRELVPKDPLEQAQFGAALFEKCRLAHNAEPKTPEGKRRQKTLWLPKIRAACKLIAEARMFLPEPKDEFDVRFDKRAFLSSDIGAKRLGLIDIGKSFEKTLIHNMPTVDPLEDFTTYTEVDPNNRLAVSQHQITATYLSLNETAHVYRNYGAGHFGNFVHLLHTRLTAVSTGYSSWSIIWAVSNIIADGAYWFANKSQSLHLIWFYDTSVSLYKLMFRDSEDGGSDQDYTSLSLNTPYYLTVERNAGTALTYIYSDSGRSTLIDTLTVSPPAIRAYSYVFSVNSFNPGRTGTYLSFISADLDLGEFQPSWAEGINTHHF